MIAKEQIQRITDIAQEKGWSVNVEDKNETRVLFEFQRYTKYGQDFLFNADMQGEYGAQNEAYMSRPAEKWVRGLCFNELGVGG